MILNILNDIGLLISNIKLHLRVFLFLKVSNTFHYWLLGDFDNIFSTFISHLNSAVRHFCTAL